MDAAHGSLQMSSKHFHIGASPSCTLFNSPSVRFGAIAPSLLISPRYTLSHSLNPLNPTAAHSTHAMRVRAALADIQSVTSVTHF